MNESITKDKLSSKNVYLKKFLNKNKVVKQDQAFNDDSLQELRDEIKKIKYTDIDFTEDIKFGEEQSYDININNNYINVLLRYAKNYSKMFKMNNNRVDPKYFDLKISANPTEFNRVHFYRPLPPILRGVGLGYKIYKALGMFLGYISSDNTASMPAQSIWFYLIQDKDFNSIVSKNFVFIIRKNLPTKEKVKIVMSYIQKYDWLFDDDDEFDIDDELIKELE